MTTMTNDTNRLSRRAFIKGAAVTAAAVAGAGVLANPAIAQTPTPQCSPAAAVKWDEETDVLVIGSGMAGATAAIEAKDAGAKVLVLEKNADLNGSSTAVCAGYITGAGAKYQKEHVGTFKGVLNSDQDTPDLFYQDILIAGLTNDPAMARILADNAGKNIDWLMEKLGMEVVSYVTATLEAQRAMRILHVKGVNGSEYVRVTGKAMTERNIPIQFGTAAKRLIVDGNARVVGVEAESGGKKKFIRARATILATGSYAGSTEMIDLLEPQLKGALASAPAGCAGDGLRMAAALGAVYTHIGLTTTSTRLALDPKDRNSERFTIETQLMARDGAIVVNAKGQRFSNEDKKAELQANLVKQSGVTFYGILDQPALDKVTSSGKVFDWVATWNAARAQQEADKGICIKKANTLKELAQKAGIDPDGLDKTVAQYNSNVEKKSDPDFGRSPATLLKLGTPPFYAVIGVGICNTVTKGGLRFDDKLQVLDIYGKPILGLYAAGSVALPQIHGNWNLCGCSISSAVTFGRIAGRNAAAAKV